jgi:chromosomal replication initiation ATPase DnaA
MINPYLFSILKQTPNTRDYIDFLIDRVCKIYEISIDQLKDNNNVRKIAEGRHTVFFILKNTTTMTLQEIADVLNKDHSSVIYALKKVDNYIYSNDKIFISRLRKVITQDELNKINNPRLTEIINQKNLLL